MFTPLRGTSDLFCALSPWRMVPDWGDMGWLVFPLSHCRHQNMVCYYYSDQHRIVCICATMMQPQAESGLWTHGWALVGEQHLRHHWLRARVNSISRISCLAVADVTFLMGATHILSSAAHPTTFSATVKIGSDTASPKPRCWRMKSRGPTGANAWQSSCKQQNARQEGCKKGNTQQLPEREMASSIGLFGEPRRNNVVKEHLSNYEPWGWIYHALGLCWFHGECFTARGKKGFNEGPAYSGSKHKEWKKAEVGKRTASSDGQWS